MKLADKNDHTSFVLGCPQCGVLFMTKNSNYGRDDILCPFGCRENHKKAKACQRSEKYRQGKESKDKKRKLNRKRCTINNDVITEVTLPAKVDPFTSYLKLILCSIIKTGIQFDEIIELQEKVRSRGLSFCQKLVHYFAYG
jgi:hypothetical protein